MFRPWQSSQPDANISNVNATATISTGGVTDNTILAHSAYSLFTTNSSDQGRSRPQDSPLLQCQAMKGDEI